ncbi:LysM peptidoglycan-binding domain-containing protein [Thermodesulfobacteriota bacterium]
MTNRIPMIPFGNINKLEIDHMSHGHMIRASALVLIFFTACFVASGCPRSPVWQFNDARAAIERARAERADLYAVESLRKAEELLLRAEEEMEAGRNRDARGHSVNARKRAERSLEITVLKREEARKEARDLVDRVQVLFENAEAKDAASLAPDRTAEAREALDESEEAFSEQDYIRSSEKASDAMIHIEDALQICSEEAVRRAEEEARKANESALPKKHIVKRGESLWHISGYADVYNDPLMWRLIYMANRDQIKDWEFIYSGQVLTIQREATPEQVREARRLAGANPPFTPPEDSNRPY